jgi:AcrR family transcriptional regulator
MEIVGTEGFSRLTIRNVAARVGITEPAVYRHFSSKRNLLAAMMEDLQGAMLPHFRSLAEDGNTLEESLRRFAESLFGELRGRPEYASFLFSEEAFHSERELKHILNRMFDESLAMVCNAIQSLQERNACRVDLDPSDIAALVMGSLRLAVSRWHLGNGTEPSEYLDRFVSVFRTILAP